MDDLVDRSLHRTFRGAGIVQIRAGGLEVFIEELKAQRVSIGKLSGHEVYIDDLGPESILRRTVSQGVASGERKDQKISIGDLQVQRFSIDDLEVE